MAAELQFRLAGPADAGAVAKLHAESWRHHYRGAYSHAFLDGDVVADRLAVWTDRLRVGSRSKAVLAKPTSPPSMGCGCATTSMSTTGTRVGAPARACWC